MFRLKSVEIIDTCLSSDLILDENQFSDLLGTDVIVFALNRCAGLTVGLIDDVVVVDVVTTDEQFVRPSHLKVLDWFRQVIQLETEELFAFLSVTSDGG